VSVSCLGKGKLLRDDRPDLFLLKEAQQGGQVLLKLCRLESFERLDTVGDHPFPAWEKPAGDNVQHEDGKSMKAIATARTA